MTARRVVDIPLGGDYWHVPYPLGNCGDWWIGTYENRPRKEDPWGGVQRGDERQADIPQGTATSLEFTIPKEYRFFSALVAGGSGEGTRLEIQIRESPVILALAPVHGIVPGAVVGAPRLVSEVQAPAIVAAGLRRVGVTVSPAGGAPPPPQPHSVPQTPDSAYPEGKAFRGENSEVFDRVWFSLEGHAGKRARIRIFDLESGGWGHINVADIAFTPYRPADLVKPVWGFADLHVHPASTLGFGGNLIAPSYDALQRQPVAALGSCEGQHGPNGLVNLGADAAAVGAVAAGGAVASAVEIIINPFDLVTDLASAGFAAGLGLAAVPVVSSCSSDLLKSLTAALMPEENPERSLAGQTLGHATDGPPDFKGWPRFTSKIHQQMHWEWIRRAYDGGLRLMCALVVNSEFMGRIYGGPLHIDDDNNIVMQTGFIKALAATHSDWMEIPKLPSEARRIIGRTSWRSSLVSKWTRRWASGRRICRKEMLAKLSSRE